MKIIINAMEIRNFNAGELVIRQGDSGDQLYIVGSGLLRCTKMLPNNEKDEMFLKDYGPGGIFWRVGAPL